MEYTTETEICANAPWLSLIWDVGSLIKTYRWTLASRITNICPKAVSINRFKLITAFYFFHKFRRQHEYSPHCNCLRINSKTNDWSFSFFHFLDVRFFSCLIYKNTKTTLQVLFIPGRFGWIDFPEGSERLIFFAAFSLFLITFLCIFLSACSQVII